MNTLEAGKNAPTIETEVALPQEEPVVVVTNSMKETKAPTTNDDRLWAMIAHLSTFLGFVIPFGNIIAPLLVLIIKGKDDMPFVARHAKESLNFQINITIYTLIAIVLLFVFVGVILLPILAIFEIVVIIMAAMKANDGEEYEYPLTIRCIK